MSEKHAERSVIEQLDVAASASRNFPILSHKVNGKRLVYLDSASSSQKPNAVLERGYPHPLRRRIHHGVYAIAEQATAALKAPRSLGSSTPLARDPCSPATRPNRSTSSRTGPATSPRGRCHRLVSMEHHANVVPWHMLVRRSIELRWLPLAADFRLDTSNIDTMLDGAKLLRDQRDVECARFDRRVPRARPTRPAHTCSSTPAEYVPGRSSQPTSRTGTPTSSLLFAQDAGTDEMSTLWATSIVARGHAALPRRWRSGKGPARRRVHHQRRPVEVRGGDDADRRGDRVRRSRRLPRDRHGAPYAPTRRR